jgi:hypothetical protein
LVLRIAIREALIDSLCCGNARPIIKRDERNVCSGEMRRLWHPLAEQGESSKTHSSCRLRVRALGSASYPNSEG